MNDIIELLQRHRSIRKFKPVPVSEDQLKAIVRSAQSASTSSNVQAYSVIRVTDPGIRKQIAAVAGNQVYVEECPLFLVWCADLYRNKVACSLNEADMVSAGTENFIIATVDTALAAQNAAIAAESMGLGVVYIGGIRNNLREVTRLLQLPELVYPVFGMCIGYPDQDPSQRPRLSVDAVLHENVYEVESVANGVREYDVRMRQYYLGRTGGKRDTTWSQEMVNKYRQQARAYIKAYLEEQGFRLE